MSENTSKKASASAAQKSQEGPVKQKKSARPIPDFTYRICMACGVCVFSCPFGCIGLSEGGRDRYGKVYPRLERVDECTGCGLCMKDCPVDCIRMVERSR